MSSHSDGYSVQISRTSAIEASNNPSLLVRPLRVGCKGSSLGHFPVRRKWGDFADWMLLIGPCKPCHIAVVETILHNDEFSVDKKRHPMDITCRAPASFLRRFGSIGRCQRCGARKRLPSGVNTTSNMYSFLSGYSSHLHQLTKLTFGNEFSVSIRWISHVGYTLLAFTPCLA